MRRSTASNANMIRTVNLAGLGHALTASCMHCKVVFKSPASSTFVYHVTKAKNCVQLNERLAVAGADIWHAQQTSLSDPLHDNARIHSYFSSASITGHAGESRWCPDSVDFG